MAPRYWGRLVNDEVIPDSKTPELPEGKHRIQLKVGNRDIYGLDFRWVDEDQITSQSQPKEVLSIERQEWGNFFGRIRSVQKGGETLVNGTEESWQMLLPLVDQANEIRGQIHHVEQDLIGEDQSRD